MPEPWSAKGQELRDLRDSIHARRLIQEDMHARELANFDDIEARIDELIRWQNARDDENNTADLEHRLRVVR